MHFARCPGAAGRMKDYEFLNQASITEISMGTGVLNIEIKPADGLFYQIVKKDTGLGSDGEQRFCST